MQPICAVVCLNTAQNIQPQMQKYEAKISVMLA